jgi:hypothetical protein
MLQQFWQPSQRLVLQLVEGRFGAKTKEKFLGFTSGNNISSFISSWCAWRPSKKTKKRNNEDNNFGAP